MLQDSILLTLLRLAGKLGNKTVKKVAFPALDKISVLAGLRLETKHTGAHNHFNDDFLCFRVSGELLYKIRQFHSSQ